MTLCDSDEAQLPQRLYVCVEIRNPQKYQFSNQNDDSNHFFLGSIVLTHTHMYDMILYDI